MVNFWNKRKKELDKVIQKPIDKVIQKPIDKVIQKPINKVIQKPILDMVPVSKTRAPSMKANVVRKIVIELMNIMRNHIGINNSITKNELFKKIFLYSGDVKKLDDWLRWEFVKKAMHYCRINTKCFIGSQVENKEWIYFVVKKDIDVKFYCEGLDKRIKSMNAMKLKAAKAVDEEWHKEEWELPEKELKLLK